MPQSKLAHLVLIVACTAGLTSGALYLTSEKFLPSTDQEAQALGLPAINEVESDPRYSELTQAVRQNLSDLGNETDVAACRTTGPNRYGCYVVRYQKGSVAGVEFGYKPAYLATVEFRRKGLDCSGSPDCWSVRRL